MVLKTFCDLNSWKVSTNVFRFSRVAGSQPLNNELLHGYFLKILTTKLKTTVFMKYIFGAFKKYVTLEEEERGRWKKWQNWHGKEWVQSESWSHYSFFFLCVHFSCNSVFPLYVSDEFLVISQSAVMKITLREKSVYTEFFLVRVFLYSNQKKLRMWTLFTQWKLKRLPLLLSSVQKGLNVTVLKRLIINQFCRKYLLLFANITY